MKRQQVRSSHRPINHINSTITRLRTYQHLRPEIRHRSPRHQRHNTRNSRRNHRHIRPLKRTINTRRRSPSRRNFRRRHNRRLMNRRKTHSIPSHLRRTEPINTRLRTRHSTTSSPRHRQRHRSLSPRRMNHRPLQITNHSRTRLRRRRRPTRHSHSHQRRSIRNSINNRLSTHRRRNVNLRNSLLHHTPNKRNTRLITRLRRLLRLHTRPRRPLRNLKLRPLSINRPTNSRLSRIIRLTRPPLNILIINITQQLRRNITRRQRHQISLTTTTFLNRHTRSHPSILKYTMMITPITKLIKRPRRSPQLRLLRTRTSIQTQRPRQFNSLLNIRQTQTRMRRNMSLTSNTISTPTTTRLSRIRSRTLNRQ